MSPRLGLGFGSRLGLVLGFGGNQTVYPKENSPRLVLGFGLQLVLGLGAIFLGCNCPIVGTASIVIDSLIHIIHLKVMNNQVINNSIEIYQFVFY